MYAYDYEKLQVMKAKTMYEMVEDLDLGTLGALTMQSAPFTAPGPSH